MIKYIYTAFIVAINVIFISLMIHGIEISLVEINNSVSLSFLSPFKDTVSYLYA